MPATPAYGLLARALGESLRPGDPRRPGARWPHIVRARPVSCAWWRRAPPPGPIAAWQAGAGWGIVAAPAAVARNTQASEDLRSWPNDASNWEISPRAAELHRSALVWDDHGGFAYSTASALRDLARWRASGIHYLSINVGFDVTPWTLAVEAVSQDRQWVREHPDDFVQVQGVDDVHRAKREGKLAVSFDLEGMDALNGDVGMVDVYYKLGVRQMLFAYNRNNKAGGGCHDEDIGLTPFGREVIREMNRVGMLVDGSHCGYRTTMQAMEASTAPVIFSPLERAPALRPRAEHLGRPDQGLRRDGRRHRGHRRRPLPGPEGPGGRAPGRAHRPHGGARRPRARRPRHGQRAEAEAAERALHGQPRRTGPSASTRTAAPATSTPRPGRASPRLCSTAATARPRSAGSWGRTSCAWPARCGGRTGRSARRRLDASAAAAR